MIIPSTSSSLDFFRDWEAYKLGFGDPEGEYWLGNEHLHELTSDGQRHLLRIEMLDWSGERTHVQYDNFSVSDEKDKFRIHLGAFSGETGEVQRMLLVSLMPRAGRFEFDRAVP